MNKDKVYLEGYVIGHAADTLGYKGLMVQLENLDIVEIDKNLVHKDINEPQLLKLKDIIARIKGFDSGTRKVWLDGILGELGSEYGSLKYKQGYDQGKFEGGLAGVERAWNKQVVPQFVGDYIKYAIENDWDFQDLFKYIEDEEDEELLRWVYHERNQETLAAAWINGYTVAKEKRYIVKVKGAEEGYNYLNCRISLNEYFFSGESEPLDFRVKHTREMLEKAGFGWVFDCPGIEIEEVN